MRRVYIFRIKKLSVSRKKGKRMRYLIYGASGFLGGTIYCKLKSAGHKVIGTYSTNKTNDELVKVEPWLAKYLVPKCEKLGYCDEDKCCGRKKRCYKN